MPATSQFTPQQILDAARRAEADNNVSYALQFYRHLVEHHPDLPESLLAREALNRLTRANALVPQVAAPPRPDVAPLAHPQPPLAANGHPGGRIIPLQAVGVSRPAPPMAVSHHAQRSHHDAEHTPHQQPRPTKSHPPARHYRFGRALATLLNLSGWVGTIAALVALIAPALTAFGVVKTLPASVPAVSLAVSLAVLAASLVLVLLSQVARATFDAADAARHAAQIGS